MARIVIIGAGLTGLSAAYHLEKKGFFDYHLFEKEADIGGLCGSVEQDGFTFDFTGHLLHIGDPYFRQLIEQLVGFENLNAITRRSFIYSQETYTRYPFQINLFGLPVKTIADCIEGYVQRKKKTHPLFFKEWVLAHFGSGFAKYFFYPYQKKIFACDLRTLTADWTGRFVPSTSLEQIIQGALTDSGDEAIGYNAQFFYPKQGGIIAWVKQLASALQQPIYTQCTVTSIDIKQKIVTFADGHIQPYDHLISSMPLDRLLGVLQEPSDSSLASAAAHLQCNSVINFNLGIARPDVSDKHWIYFPEPEIPFYRLGFPHNFAASMAPAHCSSLYGEFAYIKKSSRWIQHQLKQSLHATKKILSLSDSDIITQKIMHISHAYVIYDRWRQKNLPMLLKRLADANIYSVGRYGEWKYASMQEAVLDGKKIAEQLIILPATKSWIAPELSDTEKGKEIHS